MAQKDKKSVHPITRERLATVAEVAEHLSISPDTVRRYTKQGRLRPKVWVGRSPRFELSSLEIYDAEPVGAKN